MFFDKSPRKPILTLNLTALIDICAMLIIFLIMGTIFGEASVEIPPNLMVPKSTNKDTIDNAPQIIIFGQGVSVPFTKEKIPLSSYRDGAIMSDEHKQLVKKYLASIPAELKKSGVLLNVVADQSAPYKDIFDVIRFYREAGFQSVLFIARGK